MQSVHVPNKWHENAGVQKSDCQAYQACIALTWTVSIAESEEVTKITQGSSLRPTLVLSREVKAQ